MASVASSLHISIAINIPSTSYTVNHRLRLMPATATTLKLQQLSSSRRSVITCARRRNSKSKSSVPSSKRKEKNLNVDEEEDLDEDPFEALFQQLEEDLKNDVTFDDDDETNEEDLANLERALGEALGDDELLGFDDTLDKSSLKNVKGEEEDEEGEVEDEKDSYKDEEEDEEPLQLRRWQLKRLAYALKEGRRKIRIKKLAADLCLDRAIVLELLREPPPDLLMLSASLPDKPVSTVLEPTIEPEDAVLLESYKDAINVKAAVKVPVHEMHRSWSDQKRLKKVQIETLERVYRRSQRPTNAMISSIVNLIKVPRKKVVKWFEDKRNEDGLPDRRLPHRLPYQRSASETESVFTS